LEIGEALLTGDGVVPNQAHGDALRHLAAKIRPTQGDAIGLVGPLRGELHVSRGAAREDALARRGRISVYEGVKRIAAAR